MPNVPSSLALVISPLILSGALITSYANAEIVEIPAEEMTEAYIKNTTVIVRKQAPTVTDGKRQVIRVSPLSEDFSEGQSVAESTETQRLHSETSQRDISDQEQFKLDAQSSYTFVSPNLDPDRHVNDDNLREIFGLEPGADIDYENLQFPDSSMLERVATMQLTEDSILYGLEKVDYSDPQYSSGTLSAPGGISIGATNNQFELVIPNNGNYSQESFATPGGEFGVNITPDDITLRMTLPQQ